MSSLYNSELSRTRADHVSDIARPPADSSDFVKYLLHGSGAEHTIDYATLRKELEAEDSDMLSSRSHRSHFRDAISSHPQLQAPVVNNALPSTPIIRSSTRPILPDPLPLSETQIPMHEAAAMVAARQENESFYDLNAQITQPNNRQQQKSTLAETPNTQTTATTNTSILSSSSSSSESVDHDIIASRPGYQSYSRSKSPCKHRHLHKRNLSSEYGTAHPKSLKELSEFMTSTGLPPLPSKVMNAKLPDALQIGLDTSVAHLMNEFHRRGEIIQQLVDKMGKDKDQPIISTSPLKHHNRQPSTERANKLLEKTIDTKANTEDLQLRHRMLKQKAEQNQREALALRNQLTHQKEKNEKQRVRAEKSFDAIARQHSRQKYSPGKKSILDEMTVDVISVYESRMEELQNELNKLKTQAIKESKKKSTGDDSIDGELDAAEIERLRRYVEEIKPAEDEFLRLKRTMEQQVNLLQKQLDETNSALVKSEQEKDLLKLQMLSAKPTSITEISHINPPKNRQPYTVDTRELIRRDKLNYKLKLYKIDEIPAEQCRDLLKDVCIRLDINDVHAVVSALEEVAKVLQLVPQMQQYIKQVDEVVWAHQRAITGPVKGKNLKAKGGNHTTPRNNNEKENQHQAKDDNQAPIHKLRDTLQAIYFWAQELVDLDKLRFFIDKIFQLLKLRETVEDDFDIQALCLEEIKRLIAFEKNIYRVERKSIHEKEESEYGRIITHFCNLFEVSTVSGMFPKMNELYVFISEVEIGIKRLRDVLEMDSAIKVTTILQKASDEIMIGRALQQPHSIDLVETMSSRVSTPNFELYRAEDDGKKRSNNGSNYESLRKSVAEDGDRRRLDTKSTMRGSLESLLGRAETPNPQENSNVVADEKQQPHIRSQLSHHNDSRSSSKHKNPPTKYSSDNTEDEMRDLSAMLDRMEKEMNDAEARNS